MARDVAVAEAILTGPEPVPAYLVGRDVINLSPAELASLKRAAARTAPVRSLTATQRRNGGWGRFHSADSAGRPARGAPPTTEYAVRRARALGLQPDDPVLRRATAHLARLLEGEPFPDPPENNERWPVGTRLFASSTLAEILTEHPALEGPRRLWRTIVEQALAGGTHDPAAEQRAHDQLTSIGALGTYLALPNRYVLALLADDPELNDRTRRRLLRWLADARPAIGYLGAALSPEPSSATPVAVHRWLIAWELAVRFRLPAGLTRQLISWTDRTRDTDGWWDFGAVRRNEALPLSANWRPAGNRRRDWTTRILLVRAAARDA